MGAEPTSRRSARRSTTNAAVSPSREAVPLSEARRRKFTVARPHRVRHLIDMSAHERHDVAGEPGGTVDVPDADQAWKALGLVNDWIKHAEAKASAAMAASGVSAVLLYNLDKSQTNATTTIQVAIAGTTVLRRLRTPGHSFLTTWTRPGRSAGVRDRVGLRDLTRVEHDVPPGHARRQPHRMWAAETLAPSGSYSDRSPAEQLA